MALKWHQSGAVFCNRTFSGDGNILQLILFNRVATCGYRVYEMWLE